MCAVNPRTVIFAFLLCAVAGAERAAADHLDPPQNLQAQVRNSNVVLTWRAGGNTTPDLYRIEAGSGSGLVDLAIVNLPWSAERGLDAHFAAAGVAPGTYYVRVRAMYGSVVGLPSNEIVVHVGPSPCPIPGAPRNVSASVENRRVTLQWEASTSGAVANGYVIEAGSTPGSPNIAIVAIMDATQLAVDAPPGRYFVRLRAFAQCGSSEPSSELEIIVP